MAFSSQAQWQVINGGNDATTGFGGGFDPGNCTFTTDLAAVTATSTSPVVSSASYNFVAGDVGAWLYIASGTSWLAGWWKITSVASNLATVNAAVGAAQFLNKGLNVPNVGNLTYAGGCATTASPTAGSWTVDYSRQTTAQYTFTDAADTGAVAIFTSVANPPTVNMVGNIISWSSGTNFTVQRTQIISVSGSAATCDKNLTSAAGVGGTGKLGGAFASIGMAGSIHVGSNGIWTKYNATAFSSTSTSSNVTVGRLVPLAGTSTAMTFIRGYDAVCGDETANRPTIKWGVNASSNPLIAFTNNQCRAENLIFDGANGSFTNTRGITNSVSQSYIKNCKFVNFNANAISSTATCKLFGCEFASNVTNNVIDIGTSTVQAFGCSAHDNTATVISGSTGGANLFGFSFYNNTGAATNNVSFSGAATIMATGITMGTVGKHGFDIQAALVLGIFANCYVQGAGGWGWNFGTAMDTVVMYNCGGYNNTSGNFDVTKLTNAFDQIGFLSPSADVFTNLAGGDLTLNNTAGAGAVLRAAGWPSTYPGMTGTNYPDVGAYQHQDPASGGGGGASYSAPRAVRN